ncbi:bile acid:sodium symporter family transporter protein (plasmid) [Rhizobium gallicum]|uniref:Bile acid:sodium symporter family transporter protein n=1 Tax=Rhizobium gallicum TaxID=56730 RepID=A0A1L5NXS1_9HYPH|nr:bile acid:sodium symporter family protein [Rhizobium gallicum]APO72700.1 bile acid:sodium symporter family transporter protein [Rhizobium gallicum]
MRRFLPDTMTLLLICTVVTASLRPAHGAFANYFSIATDIAIGLLFFLHGARLSRDVAIAGLLHWRLHLVILTVTFVVFPLLGMAFGLLPENVLPRPLFFGILFLCVLPSTVQSSIAFTSMAGGNVSAAICAASASNILGIFLTPVLVGLLFAAHGHVGGLSLNMLQKIMLQLLAPFIAGQMLQPWIGDWVRARKKLLTPIDRGSILMVVYLAFSHAVVDGIWTSFSPRDIVAIMAVNAVLLTFVLCLTMFGSRLMGFGKEDEIAITFCGSKKSLASGIPIANVIFAGQPLGAIVLPIMMFHQLQLMICAIIAQRYASRQKIQGTAETSMDKDPAVP